MLFFFYTFLLIYREMLNMSFVWQPDSCFDFVLIIWVILGRYLKLKLKPPILLSFSVYVTVYIVHLWFTSFHSLELS